MSFVGQSIYILYISIYIVPQENSNQWFILNQSKNDKIHNFVLFSSECSSFLSSSQICSDSLPLTRVSPSSSPLCSCSPSSLWFILRDSSSVSGICLKLTLTSFRGRLDSGLLRVEVVALLSVLDMLTVLDTTFGLSRSDTTNH